LKRRTTELTIVLRKEQVKSGGAREGEGLGVEFSKELMRSGPKCVGLVGRPEGDGERRDHAPST